MLTRLQVRGFKNLADVDIRFGPFTCIAGPNGAGKSNVFDAILFLSELADKPFVDAARSIRGGEDLGGLFAAHGAPTMWLAAEMLIPRVGKDDLGQTAEACATHVRYELQLALEEPENHSTDRIRIRLDHESLDFRAREGLATLPFPHTQDWLNSVIFQPTRHRRPFIHTSEPTHEPATVILYWDALPAHDKDHQQTVLPASTLPRTVLSSADNAKESRTAVLVRQEMRKWRLLQLEPSAMRQPDDFQSEDRMTMSGGHIPATLHRIAHQGNGGDNGRVYAAVANRLAELVEGVRSVRVERDRVFKTLMVTDRYGLELPASALSDGTLRFVALAVLQQDPRESGVICLEEPENGIHPQSIDAMLLLLYDIAVDSELAVDDENPLRQIIVNTHSPVLAGSVAEGDLLFAGGRTTRLGKQRVPELHFSCLDSTWRAQAGSDTISKGVLLGYLKGISPAEDLDHQPQQRRVIDRFDSGQNTIGDETR